jgi:hypothetical protein
MCRQVDKIVKTGMTLVWIYMAAFAGPSRSQVSGQAQINPEAMIVTCRAMLSGKNVFASYDEKDQALCFQGLINKVSATQAIEILKSKPVKTLVISSPGGSVLYALDMAEYIQAKKIDIVINRVCVSSCANYLFLAARYKYVTEGSFVGWHGGPEKNLKKVRKRVKRLRKRELKENPQTVFNESLDEYMVLWENDLERQRKLLARAGVSDDLLYVSVTGAQAVFLKKIIAEHKKSMIFVPGPEDLSGHYSVKGLVNMWHPGVQASLERYMAALKTEAKASKGEIVFDAYLFTFPPDSW